MTVKRKLAAILAADVVGFSRLASRDEDRTLARLRALRSDVLDPTVAVHNGRVVKRTGDGAIIEFRSVVDAVRCAIEVQNAMVERNAGLPADRRIQFRVGIHLGDIVEESDGDLMGDGVNIAARLEGLAEPGAICMSEDAFRQVRSRMDLAIEDLGEKRLKNIVEPVRVYMLRVGVPAGEPSQDLRRPGRALSNEGISAKPIVAVMPFLSLSHETNQRFFADGLSEDLITRLSYLRGLAVVSRTSSFVFRDTGKSVAEISRELGAHFVLEGSIRMSGSRLRAIANLIDGATGLSLWSQRFDRDLTDLFEVQDEITHAIVVALQVTLVDGEMALDPGGTKDYAAWEAFQKGALAHLKYTNEDLITARRLFSEAVRIDPTFVDARVMHAWTYWQRARSGFAADREEEYAACRRHLDSLLALETETASLRHLEAATLMIERRYDEALLAAKKAVRLGPSKLFGYTPSALARIYSGDLQGAADILRETIRTIPATPNDTVYNLAYVLLLKGEHGRALTLAEEYARRVPTDLFAHLLLAHAQSFNQFPDRAREIMTRFREAFPAYRLSDFEAHEPFRDRSVLDTLLGNLRAAGLT